MKGFHSYVARHAPWLPDRFRAIVDMIRPFTMIAPAIGVLSFALFALIVDPNQSFDWSAFKLIIYGAVTLTMLNAASNVWNQACEVAVDSINKPDRPIPSGRITVDEARIIAVVIYIVALARATFMPMHFTLAVYALMVITITYSHPSIYLKKRLVINNLAIAVARGYILPWAGWCLFGDPLSPIIHAACLILAVWTFGAISTKDIPDRMGDSIYGIRTFPSTFGVRKTLPIVAGSVISPFVLVPVFIANGIFPVAMWSFFITLPIGISIIYLLYSGRDTESIIENRWSWVLMYIQFLAMMIAFPIIFLVG